MKTLLVLFICHMIGDFYLQPNKMAKNKVKLDKVAGWGWLVGHGIIYVLVMGVIFFFTPCEHALLPWGIISLSHFLIDIVKIVMEGDELRQKEERWLEQKQKNGQEKKLIKRIIQKILQMQNQGQKRKWWYFVADQILHISIIVGCYWFFLQSNPGLLQQQMIYVLPQFKTALVYVTIVLIVIKPASLFVACVFESRFHIPEKQEELNEGQNHGNEKDPPPIQGAGKWIGIMERLIVVALVLLNATGAIGFVLTAKSIARYTQIAEKQVTAESYLIGTLLSVGIALGAVFVIPLLCP